MKKYLMILIAASTTLFLACSSPKSEDITPIALTETTKPDNIPTIGQSFKANVVALRNASMMSVNPIQNRAFDNVFANSNCETILRDANTGEYYALTLVMPEGKTGAEFEFDHEMNDEIIKILHEMDDEYENISLYEVVEIVKHRLVERGYDVPDDLIVNEELVSLRSLDANGRVAVDNNPSGWAGSVSRLMARFKDWF